MSLPMTFDNVSYFGNEYRGDLVITHGIIYYFPHTNVASEKNQRREKLIDQVGLLAIPLDFLLTLANELRTTTNKPRHPTLQEINLWRVGESSRNLQARLDACVAEMRGQPTQLVEYEYTLPKPMRFARADIRNLSTRGRLRFDTEYDSHDFSIRFYRKKMLREALWEGGFRH